MPTVRVSGPISWVQPAGANGLLPGQVHTWAIIPPTGVVFSVSAHPSPQYTHQALAITEYSVAYGSAGTPPALNFNVRNVSDTGVRSYRLFIASIDL